ncbi:MAG: hypothetical protein ACOYY3_02475 [Chloroflexota bacterium]
MKMTSTDRILILLTALLSGYQIVVGIDGLGTVPITAYTIAFGALLVAMLLMLILGFGVLDSPVVVIVSTVIPLALALGLAWEHLASYRILYLLFTLVGFAAIIVTRSLPFRGKLPTFVLAVVHGIAGLTIFLLPSILAADGTMKPGFALVGLGGAMIGLGGLLLSFLKAGRPILPRETILKVLPGLFMLMTACFVAGFKLG